MCIDVFHRSKRRKPSPAAVIDVKLESLRLIQHYACAIHCCPVFPSRYARVRLFKLQCSGELCLCNNVNRVVGDSGAVFTTESTKNSELKNAIFKIFALKLVELTSIKGLANNCQNKTSL